MRNEDSWVPSAMDEELRYRLLELVAEDDRVRAELASDGALFDGYHPRMAAVHEANACALEAALNDGWPSIERVGEDGAEAAWRIGQHAISLPAFQRRCLKLIEKAVERGEVPARHAAFLADRIRMFEGRPQIYGTQFDWDENGEMSPLPIEAPAGVDARRAAVGLAPLEEAVARHRESVRRAGERPSNDPSRRRAEFEAWARKAGWRH